MIDIRKTSQKTDSHIKPIKYGEDKVYQTKNLLRIFILEFSGYVKGLKLGGGVNVL
jgi:hypothetical protein